jgi:hypothetical protein
VYELLRSLFALESGRNCRTCAESIDRRDAFGLSEAVCASCRA